MLLELTEHSPESRRTQITRQARSKLLHGDIEDGAPLPPPHPIARTHHVPAPAAAQAFDALIVEGLLPDGAGGFRP